MIISLLIAISLEALISIALHISNFFIAESDSFQRRMNFSTHGAARRPLDGDADANADANTLRRPICRRAYVRAQSQ